MAACRRCRRGMLSLSKKTQMAQCRFGRRVAGHPVGFMLMESAKRREEKGQKRRGNSDFTLPWTSCTYL